MIFRRRKLPEAERRAMLIQGAYEDFVFDCCCIPHSKRPPELQEALRRYFKSVLDTRLPAP